MTDTQDISGAFPPPPSHYTLFTSANVAAHKAGELDETTAAYFHPPQIPKESYTLFGQTWPVVDRIASLQESGIEQLFDDRVDVAENAKSLARSLLLKFLDIVQTMAVDPEAFPAKLEQVRLLLLNLHNLINNHRPTQTREILIAMVKQSIARSRREVDEIGQACDEAETLINKYSRITKAAAGSIENDADDEPMAEATVPKTEDKEDDTKEVHTFDELLAQKGYI